MNIDALAFFVFAIPGTVILLRTILAFTPKIVFPNHMRVRKKMSYKPSVTVVVPCYNEGRAVYDTIKSIWESDYPKDKLTICPQDDGSKDDSYDWILKAAQDFDRVYPERNEKNSGKTFTYLRAADRTNSDIVMIVDSDTILMPDAIKHMMADFADSRLGVVGAPLGTLNPNTNMLTAMQTYLYFFGLRIAKVSESHFQGVAVIGGYALAVRRRILEDLKPQIINRNWFGVPVKDGEDRFITHLSSLQGWGTYVEPLAETRAYALESYDKYFGQQLRWKRSLIRTYMWVLRTLPMQISKMNPAAIWAMFTSGSIVFILFLGVLGTALLQPLSIFGADKFVPMLGVTSAIMIWWWFKYRDQYIHNPLKMVLFTAWWIVNLFFLVIVSLFTLDQDAWGNRDIKKTLQGAKSDSVPS